MIGYASKYRLFANPAKIAEFEVLNELKDLSNRKDSNCLTHTRFLLEMDETPLSEQYANVPSVAKYCRRITYSGSKSLHHIIEFAPAHEDQCAHLYKEIHSVLNQMLFNGCADTACANPARLTRRPGAIRDNGKIQELVYSGELLDEAFAKTVLRKARSDKARTLHIANQMRTKNTNSKNRPVSVWHNGLCATYEKVTRYLDTAFPKLHGNGCSEAWLFGAMSCCVKYNDMATLDRVIAKAKKEHWSDNEIKHKLDSINNRKETI